jgi:cytochrome c oxidase subunit 2
MSEVDEMSKYKSWLMLPFFVQMMLLLTGCGSDTLSALIPRGPVAAEQYSLIKLSFFIMTFVILVVFAIYIIVVVRFRQRKNQQGIPKQVEGNLTLEFIWTIVPIFLLVILAIPTLQQTFKQSKDYTKDPNAIHIKVTAYQFWWQFEYPDLNIVTAQDMVIPAGKKIALEVTAADVKHSFWVPSLAGKLDNNPGLTNIFYLESDDIDVFKGKCAELCGASHSLMNFSVVALSESDFDAWTTKMKTPTQVPASVAKGEQLFKENCMACHAVTPEGLGLGPNLNGFASRTMIAGILEHNSENLAKWTKNPQDQKPGNKMPAFGQSAGGPLNDNQINDIVNYLNTLK